MLFLYIPFVTLDYILICLSPNLYLMVSYFLLMLAYVTIPPSLTESVPRSQVHPSYSPDTYQVVGGYGWISVIGWAHLLVTAVCRQ